MLKQDQESKGCDILEKLFDDGDVRFTTILKKEAPKKGARIPTTETHTVFFVEISSSLGKSPCEYPKPPKSKDTKCYLIRKKVRDADGKLWDWYLMSCPHGPPCLFMQNL
jgi:hypothetical protein